MIFIIAVTNMYTRTVHVRPVNNKVLSKALNKINTIIEELDTKLLEVHGMLEEEIVKLTDDNETACIIDDIMVRLIEEFPDRICFMNELYHTTSNASDDGYEED